MLKSVFMKLPELKDEDDITKLKIGDRFLYGRSVINQKQDKKDGSTLTYFEVISKSQNGIEYTPIYDYMEKGEELWIKM